jgi:ketosteroid isomerase-like protein
MALLKRKRTGLGDAMEVVTRFVNACNRHDADGVYACLHPDFDSIQPMYPSRNFRGADQVRRNWQAIFDAEPGFRLTVLRSAVVDDTIWLELHGAGEDAEVAGVFVMGIQGDRIRWARIYSALVEPVPEGVGEPPAPLREVPRHDQPPATSDSDVVEEALIAPVLDMDRGGRRRRRRRGADSGAEGELTDAGEAEADEEAGTDAEETVAGDADVAAIISGNADMQTTVVVEGDDQVAVVESDDQVAVAVDDVAVVAEGDAEVTVAATDDVVTVVVDGDSDVVDAATGEPAPEVPVAPADDEGGPPTEAVDMVTITTDAAEEPAPDPDPDGPPRRGLFGRKRP